MASSIELRGVHKSFHVRDEKGRSGGEFVALENVDFFIEAGAFVTLVGPSGCGKSTILDLIAGLLEPTAGQVLVNGELVTKPGLDRAVVFQQYALLPWRTALGNVEFALEAQNSLSAAQRTSIANEMIELVGLSEFAHRYPHELSGGMKQRVAIARGLSCSPNVLLMDEPFGALDAQTKERLQNELREIWRTTGTTIVFITHDIDEAVILGQRVAVMGARPGRIKQIFDIDIDRTLSTDVRSQADFTTIRHEVWSSLHDSHEAVAEAAMKGQHHD